MSVTIINNQGGRITLENIEPQIWWCQRLHQLFDRRAIAAYLIRP